MATQAEIAVLRGTATQVKNESQVGGNTAGRVGGLFEGIVDALPPDEAIDGKISEAVADIQPIVIEGNVDNAPDQEDLTSVNQGGTDVLKFKDKTYAPALFSGLGRVYLRKNVVTPENLGYSVNLLTAEMVAQENTIYHIQYDYDLNGQTITIPAGCVLEFDGGSIANGTLVGNGTFLNGYKFIGVEFSGSFSNETLSIGDDTFVGTPNLSNIISTFANAQIVFFNDYPSIKIDVTNLAGLNIIGNGHALKLGQLVFATTANVYIDGVVFDCSEAVYTGAGDKGLVRLSGGSNVDNSFIVRNCEFTGFKNANMIYLRAVNKTIISDCTFDGADGTDVASCIFLYNLKGDCRVENNRIRNIYGGGISIIPPSEPTSYQYTIANNYIYNVRRAGIQSAGGVLYNTNICSNFIINANRDNEGNGGTNWAAINMHGAINVNIDNNFVESTNPANFDIDGLTQINGADALGRGVNISITNNHFKGKAKFALVNLQNLTFENNTAELTNVSTSSNTGLITCGGENLLIKGNYIIDTDTIGKAVFVNSSLAANNILICDNTLIKNASVWFETSAVTISTGSIYIYKNVVKKAADSIDIPLILDRASVVKPSPFTRHILIPFNTSQGVDYPIFAANGIAKRGMVTKATLISMQTTNVWSTEQLVVNFVRKYSSSINTTEVFNFAVNRQFGPNVEDSISLKYNLQSLANWGNVYYKVSVAPTADNIDFILDLELASDDMILYT